MLLSQLSSLAVGLFLVRLKIIIPSLSGRTAVPSQVPELVRQFRFGFGGSDFCDGGSARIASTGSCLASLIYTGSARIASTGSAVGLTDLSGVPSLDGLGWTGLRSSLISK